MGPDIFVANMQLYCVISRMQKITNCVHKKRFFSIECILEVFISGSDII